MPILAYCVSLTYDYLDAPTEGVGQAMIYELENIGLRAWYSEVEADTFAGAENVTKAALDFHRFVSAVFREGTVLPFKFPTILETPEELQAHLEEKATWYNRTLQRSQGLVQFEARFLNKTKVAGSPESGTEYLQGRKQQLDETAVAVSGFLQGLEDYLREHHTKESQQGTRVYLLVERGRIAEFRENAGRLAIPPGFEIRLTGPWPPTEFVSTQEGEQ